MEIIYNNSNGQIIHGDNLEVLAELNESSVDSCISDFPYAIEFMGKNWDSVKCWNQGKGVHGQFPGTGYSGKKRPAFYANSNQDMLMFYDWCIKRANSLLRIMKPGGYVAIFGHPKTNHRMKCAFEDRASKLPDEIEHIKPDYHLYDSWVQKQLENGVKRKELTYYLDWSIGFTTRGCIRKCEFCVNKSYNRCSLHSSLVG